MSTLSVDNPGVASAPVSSVGDVARLINSGKDQAKYARMIVFLALGGVFLDAYDLTTLSYGIDDVVREFQLSPLLTGLVTSSIMVGTIIGNLIGGWLTDKYGRYSVFMADMLFFVVSAIAAGLAPNVWVLIGARFLMGIGVGIDLPVAMSYLAEFSRFTGKQGRAPRRLVPDVVRRFNGMLSDYLRPLFPAAAGAPRLAVARLAAVWRRPGAADYRRAQ